MHRHIGIKDLVVNALIELIKEKETNRKISLLTLSEYGVVIAKRLRELGQDVILFLTRESTYEFIHDYADYFFISESEDIDYIELKEGITVDVLREQFRENLTVDFARAMYCEDSIEVLRNRETLTL